jgi:hypothetical protein
MATTRYVSHLYEVGPIRLKNFITDIQHLMGAATDRPVPGRRATRRTFRSHQLKQCPPAMTTPMAI